MMTSLQRLNSIFQEGLMIGCVESAAKFHPLSPRPHTRSKKRPPRRAAKSREETPKEGDHSRYLTPDLAAITYVALHNKSENRPSQGHIACGLNRC